MFIDYATDKPIADLSIRLVNKSIVTDKTGLVKIPDTSRKVIASGFNYELKALSNPFPDTIYMFNKPYELKTVVVSKVKYKRPKLYLKKYSGIGCLFKHQNMYIKTRLDYFDAKTTKIRFRINQSKFKNLDSNCKIKIEFRKVNCNWEDTTKQLFTFNNDQINIFNKLKVEDKCVAADLIYSKTIPLKSITQNYIDIHLDSLKTEESEAFICIGVELNNQPLNQDVGLFRSQITHSGNIAYIYKGIWNFPLMYFNIVEFDSHDRIFVPYFEFIEVKP